MSTRYPRVAESRLEMSTYPLTVVTVRTYCGLGIDWKQHALHTCGANPDVLHSKSNLLRLIGV